MGRLCCIICSVITVVFIGGFIWLLVWLAHRSHWHIRVNVESANLTRFDLDLNQTLAYNLTLRASVRNANRATVYYKKLEARADYGGQQFGVANLTTFTQRRKSTEMIYPAFHGRSQMPGDSPALEKLRREKGEGFYSIDVKIYMEITLEWLASAGESGATYTARKGYAPEVNCSLKVPVPRNGTASAGFNATPCTVKCPEQGRDLLSHPAGKGCTAHAACRQRCCCELNRKTTRKPEAPNSDIPGNS
ncbi:hypothetical protein Taro_016228 [Colocasia esculenta]|uniref:Late embryogenesis abundant protein LEA-2 subgroup domain-containing protein n=1 Tax=Colocasia esculenta TaxID=4460 RepID=A0A843UPJ2_COLES|nr:hypothetical protein [Colocasia esculenta]